jgi:hypothetical protein
MTSSHGYKTSHKYWASLARWQRDTGEERSPSFRPQATRLSSSYLTFNRITNLEETIKIVVQEDRYKNKSDCMVFQGDKKAIDRANAMAAILAKDDFWSGVKRYILISLASLNLY